MASTFRSLFKFLVPRVFIAGDGEKVYYSWSIMHDAFAQRMLDSLRARFPLQSLEIEGALERTGQDRGIIRGRTETALHYARRLVAWRYPRGHRVRGSAFAALEQISEYWGGIMAWSIDRRGNWHKRAARNPDDTPGAESFAYGYVWDWDGAAVSPQWARFWDALDGTGAGLTEQRDWTDSELWGEPDELIGQLGATRADVLAMRRLMRAPAWKPAGTRAEWFIVVLDGQVPGVDVVPDGNWGHWSRNDAGTQVSTRWPGWRYWAYDPARNVYAGNPASFANSFDNVDASGVISGDATLFPDPITLPDGSTYSGDPASFPLTLQLPDDGDLVQ